MNGILVPRFYNTNIVYDDIPANSILTLDTNSYSSITLQDGILAKSNNTVGFTKPTGLLYGSMNNDVWTLNSTSITHGILINSSNVPVFNSITGLIYGKNNNNNWNIDSVPLQQGILTMSNNTLLSFTNPTNVLYATNTGTSWALNGVDDINNYTDNNDYVLYYGKHNNNIVPHWRALTVTGRNFAMSGDAITAPWKTLLVNSNTDNIVAVPTEAFNATEYGVFDNTGKVVKLSSKIMNDIGFKIFSPSEINEQGILTANIIIYNSSTDNISLPVNYFSCLNFHSRIKTERGDISESMQNTSYTDGFYNYTTVSNNLPVYDSIKNTYNGFYSYIYDNNISSNDYYIHYTTSIDIDSIYFPPDNTAYTNTGGSYTLATLSAYKIIIGVFTNFSEISSDMPYYKNIFFCNQSTPVISQYDTHVLLGYLIVDLKDIDTTGIIHINRQYDIDSTVPVYNTKIDTEELKNGTLCFRPLYYIKQDGTILSLYYNDQVEYSPLFENIESLTRYSITFKNTDPAVTIEYNEHYTYNGDKIQFNANKMVVESSTKDVYVDSTLILPKSYMTERVEQNQAFFNKTYCDINNDDINNPYYLYPLTYYFKPFSYFKYNDLYCTNDVLGYTKDDSYFYNIHITSYNQYLKPHVYILNNSIYASNNTGIYNRSNPSVYIISDPSMFYVEDGYIHVKHNDRYEIDNYNNVCYGNKILFTYGTYMDQKLSVDTLLLYIDENSNVHFCVSKIGNTNTTTSNVTSISDIVNEYFTTYAYDVPTHCVLGATVQHSKVGPSGFNSNIYTINGNYVYETRPMLYKNDYTLHKDIIIENVPPFKYIMNKGVLYNNEYYIFNANEAKLNVIGQIIISGDKYGIGNINGHTAIINTTTNTVVVTDNNIKNNHHIEITNSNFSIIDCKAYQLVNSSVKCLCERLCPIQDIPQLEYNEDNGLINIESNNTVIGYYSYNFDNTNTRYYQNLIIRPDFCITRNERNVIKIENDKIRLVTNDAYSPRNNELYAVITEGGVYINNKYATTLVNNNNIIYTNDYVEIPFFDTPVEKDMKIIITPITKYTILAYNNISYSTNANTLSNIIGYKISLCNINATLTTYVGEYPSIIN